MQADGKRLARGQRNTACLQGSNIAHIDQEAVVDAQKTILCQFLFQCAQAHAAFQRCRRFCTMKNQHPFLGFDVDQLVEHDVRTLAVAQNIQRAGTAAAGCQRLPKIVRQFFGQLKLGQKAKRTYLVSLGGIFAVICHKDQHRVLADRAHLPRKCNAVHIAHINVQKNHVGFLHGCLFQCVGVMDAFDLHITAVELRLCFDQSFQCFGKYRVIVTQQNVQHTVTGFRRWIFNI